MQHTCDSYSRVFNVHNAMQTRESIDLVHIYSMYFAIFFQVFFPQTHTQKNMHSRTHTPYRDRTSAILHETYKYGKRKKCISALPMWWCRPRCGGRRLQLKASTSKALLGRFLDPGPPFQFRETTESPLCLLDRTRVIVVDSRSSDPATRNLPARPRKRPNSYARRSSHTRHMDGVACEGAQ